MHQVSINSNNFLNFLNFYLKFHKSPSFSHSFSQISINFDIRKIKLKKIKQ